MLFFQIILTLWQNIVLFFLEESSFFLFLFHKMLKSLVFFFDLSLPLPYFSKLNLFRKKNIFVFFIHQISFILLFISSFIILISFFLNSFSLLSLSFFFLNNHFPFCFRKNSSNYLLHMHALPLYVTLLFIHWFICCLFFLFGFSRFYPHVFSFSFFCFLCLWPSFNTSIWQHLHFWYFYSFVWHFYSFICFCMFILSLCLVFFVFQKKFSFLFLFLCVFEHSPFFCSDSLIPVFPLFFALIEYMSFLMILFDLVFLFRFFSFYIPFLNFFLKKKNWCFSRVSPFLFFQKEKFSFVFSPSSFSLLQKKDFLFGCSCWLILKLPFFISSLFPFQKLKKKIPTGMSPLPLHVLLSSSSVHMFYLLSLRVFSVLSPFSAIWNFLVLWLSLCFSVSIAFFAYFESL